MRNATLTATIALAALILLATSGGAQDSVLLSDNGLGNAQFSEYGDAPRHVTGGSYTTNPALATAQGKTTFSFSEGAFTNGDSSFISRREPAPYAYWQGQQQGELLIDLGAVYQIDRVRLCVLSPEEGPHGTARIDVALKGDPLEFPDVLRVGRIEPVADGWNELTIDRRADGLRLVFRRAPGKAYITISEIEVWGRPLPEGEQAPTLTASPADPKRSDGGFTWWAFDFGPADSPSFAGFYVTDSHAVYSPERGFGWIPYHDGRPATESNFGPASSDVPGLGERDRGGLSSDPLYRDLLTVSRYYHTQVRQTFAVDLPDGTYRVVTFHGDLEYGTPGEQCYWIEAEGQVVADDIVLPIQRTTDAVFDVTVTDGRLELTLDAEHEDPAREGWVINGLVILPAGTDAEREFADAKIAQIRAAIERVRQEAFEQNFVELEYPDFGEMVAPTDEERARGFIGWVPNWMTLVYRQSVPHADDERAAVMVTAAPGEYEPATVAIRALDDLTGVHVETDNLTAGVATIPADAIEVRTVRCWPQRIGSSWGNEYRVVPELLEARAAVDVPADTTQQFWLTVHVPEDAAPGNYTGRVAVVADDGRWELPLRLTVLPFTLAPAERPVGMYWHDERVEGEVQDAQIRDLVAHGCTAVTLDTPVEITNVDGQMQFDGSRLIALLRKLKTMGITGPIPYNGGLEGRVKRAFPDEFDARYVEAIARIEELTAGEDTPELLYYPVDEIGNSDERGQRAHELCALIAQAPGATSYITVNNYAAGEKWGDNFDIWCGNIEYTAEQEEALLARGKRYMRYGSAYLNDCRRARNSSGLGFYRRPAEAMYYWHYQHYSGDPYNDFDGTSRDHCAAYPGANGEPIPTLDWESIREGIDDMRYIATLKALAARAAQGTAAQRAVGERARAELDAVLSVGEGVNQYSYAEHLSDEEYAGLRTRLIEQILALQAALGE